MGRNHSREAQQQQGAQNNNLSHLTTDPHYQQILRQVYANNSPAITDDFPQYRGNFNYHPNRHRPNLEVKKAIPIKNELYISKNSIKLVINSIILNEFSLSLRIIRSIIFILNLTAQYQLRYLFSMKLKRLSLIKMKQKSIQIIDAEQILEQNHNLNYKKILTLLLEIIKNFLKMFFLQISQNSTSTIQHILIFNCIIFHASQKWLIIKQLLILKQTRTDNNNKNNEKRSMIIYCNFIANKDNSLSITVIRIKIEKNGRVYLANDVYGLAENQYDKEDLDEKECAICLTEKIDTMILPCKHMCLCNNCCQDLRFRTLKCPICRRTIERFIKVERGKIKKQRTSEISAEQIIQQKDKEERKSSDQQNN